MCTAPTHIVMYDEGIRVNYTAFLLAVVALVGLTVWDAVAFPTIQVEAPDKLTRDAMFTGGAAILGLVVFGSALSMLFKNFEPSYSDLNVIMLAAGIACGATGSLLLMFTAYVFSNTDGGFFVSMAFIGVGVGLILLTIGRVFDLWLNRRKQNDSS